MREHLFGKQHAIDRDFRWRGGSVSRVEGLSDGVFALALAMMMFTLDVPHTFDELDRALRGFLPFAAVTAMIAYLWYSHYLFFRRYGLEDAPTIVLNFVFLFTVLFYAFPLKFLASLLLNRMVGLPWGHVDASGEFVPFLAVDRAERAAQWTTLMLVYGVGFILCFGLLALMHWRAWALRVELELDEIELVHTGGSLRANAISMFVGAVSVLLVLLGLIPWAGFAYPVLMSSLHWVNGARTARRVERLRAALTTSSNSGVSP
jgi:uncharacterized membrane protein